MQASAASKMEVPISVDMMYGWELMCEWNGISVLKKLPSGAANESRVISVLTGCLTHLGPAWASWGQLVPAGASWYNTLKLASCHVHRPCPNPLQSPHRVMTSK